MTLTKNSGVLVYRPEKDLKAPIYSWCFDIGLGYISYLYFRLLDSLLKIPCASNIHFCNL